MSFATFLITAFTFTNTQLTDFRDEFCLFNVDSYAIECGYWLDILDYSKIFYITGGLDMDWRIEPRMTRNDNQGVSLSQSWAFVMTSFANVYTELSIFDSIFFKVKSVLIPFELEFLKFTWGKDFINGPFCVSLGSSIKAMHFYTAIAENIKQCAVSALDIPLFFFHLLADQSFDYIFYECLFDNVS